MYDYMREAENLEEAVKNAYAVVDKIKFANAYYRKDIGLI